MLWLKIVTYGFYMSMILWVSGMVTSILIDNKIISLLFIGIPFAIYILYSIEDIHRTQDDKRGWKQCRSLIKMSGQSRYGSR